MIDMELFKNRYAAMNGIRPIPSDVLAAVTTQLGLQLPSDFLEIGKFFDGSGINVISLHSLAGNAPTMNPIHETLRLREAIGLPINWLVLGEPPESLLLMDCSAEGQVVWIDAIDAKRIASQSFATQPTRWNSFAEFFEYLLGEEEADR